MEIINNTTNGQFEIRAGDHLAFITYRIREDKIYLMHTEVPEALAGQGIGSALVRHAVAYAQTEGLVHVAYCTFARGYLEKHPQQ